MAEVTLKEESALEIGKSLLTLFKDYKRCDTATNGLELEEERQQTSY